MKRRGIVMAVALCVLAAGFWLARRSGDDHGVQSPAPPASANPRAASQAAADETAADVAAAPSPAKASAPMDPLDDRPLLEVRAELERRAQAGDAHAASRLGQAFLHCNDLPNATDTQIEDLVVEIAAHGGHILGQADSSLSPDAAASLLKGTMKYAQARCANARGIDEKDAPAQALHWIERAAALGDADAQALYGEALLKTYDARRAIADAETLRDRLQQARSYVEQSLSKGDALALLQRQSYYGDGVYPADPEAAYANLFAWSLTPRSAEMPPDVLTLMLSEASKTLDADAVERAREEGRRLAACCGGVEGAGQ